MIILMFIFSFGNFVNRTVKFITSQYDGVLPDSPDVEGPLSLNDVVDAEFIADVNRLIREYTDAMESVKLRLGLQTVMHLSARGNLYLQASGLGKALMTENPARCAQVLTRAINLIYVLSALIHPFMPVTSDSILTQLSAPPRIVPEAFSIDILPGHQLGTPSYLFTKIDEKMADTWRSKFGGSQPAAEPDADATHVAPAMSKRKAAAAMKASKKAAEAVGSDIPKSAEVLAWEQKVAEQGQVVREMKARPKSEQVDKEIAEAVEELKKLKVQLSNAVSASKL
jgi:methionyl-tRNA synthetase